MARAIWSGAISFGLINVPVKLYSAVSKQTVRFHQLHDADGVRIKQKRVCPQDGEEVSYEHIVKGYELSPDRYVVITPEELESIQPRKTRSIDIEEFVDLEEIDPIYFEHPYYLVPDKGAAKAYGLLIAAMQESGKVAIGKVVLRTKEYLVAIRPMNEVLVMATMLFADEVVPQSELEGLLPDGDGAEPSEKEVSMARQLIESLSSSFEPESYRDTYREAVLEMIERKAEGQEIAVQPEADQPVEVPDLMAALEQSLAAVRKEKPAAAKSKSDGNGGGRAKSKPKTKAKAKSTPRKRTKAKA
jgi:DNA end-binding protein Ku